MLICWQTGFFYGANNSVVCNKFVCAFAKIVGAYVFVGIFFVRAFLKLTKSYFLANKTLTKAVYYCADNRKTNMQEYLKSKMVKLRCKKSYQGAHTHIIVGRVLEENQNYIAIMGKTFHFGRIVDGMKNQIFSGAITERIVPWNNVEIVHPLSDESDFSAPIKFDGNGNLVLCDTAHTLIAEKRDEL